MAHAIPGIQFHQTAAKAIDGMSVIEAPLADIHVSFDGVHWLHFAGRPCTKELHLFRTK